MRARTALVVTATLVGAALRAYQLSGHQGLTGDEGFSLALAQRSFSHMLGLFRWEGNGVLYPLVLWPVSRVGDSVSLLRLPSLLAGTLAIPALYWTGKRLLGAGAGLVAALLLAVSPLAVSYSQLARPYMFALLFSIVSFGLLDLALAEPTKTRWWVLYAAATAGAAYSNAFALPILISHAVLVPRYPARTRRWLRSLVGVAALLAPLAVLLVWERSKRNPLYWVNRPDLQEISRLGSRFMVDRYGLLLAVAVLPVAFAPMTRRRSSDLGLAAVAAWAFVLPALLLLTSLVVSPVFSPEYALPALPGAFLLVGAATTRSHIVAGAVVTALVLLSLRATALHPDWFHAAGWRSASAALANTRQPGDPVLFDIPDGLGSAGYYNRSFAAPDGRLVVSEWHDEHIPSGVYLLDDPGGYGDVHTGPPSRQLITQLANQTGRVFLMLYAINRQGPSDAWPGIRWARNRCMLTTRTFGDAITMIGIRNCRSD